MEYENLGIDYDFCLDSNKEFMKKKNEIKKENNELKQEMEKVGLNLFWRIIKISTSLEFFQKNT